MKLIILDRDGVINHDSPHYIKSPEEWLPIRGSLAAIGRLKQLGYTIAVASNQSGIARGLYTESILTMIHQKMQTELTRYYGMIDFICYCPHHPEDHCNCRKPKLGLFKKIQTHFNLSSLKNIYYVGDSPCDIEAALQLGCQPILVKTGKGIKTSKRYEHDSNICVFENLSTFVKQLSC